MKCGGLVDVCPVGSSLDPSVACRLIVLAQVPERRQLRTDLALAGHFEEMGHGAGRVTPDFVRPRLAKVRAVGGTVVVPRWGERIV